MITRRTNLPRRTTLARRVRACARSLGRSLALAFSLAFVAGFVLLAAWPPLNDVSTGETAEYPDLQPRDYRFSQDRLLSACREVIRSEPRYSLVAVDETSGLVEATVEGRWGVTMSELSVRLEPNGDGGTIVFIRSRGRRGPADFGRNARIIRKLLLGIDANLGVIELPG